MRLLLIKSDYAARYQRLLARRNGGDPDGMARDDAKFKEMADDYHDWHGHVRPRPDGMKARCGGTNFCSVCKSEAEQYGSLTKARPTPAQAEAGNYKKPRVRWNGLEIAIENPVGSTREGKGWKTTMRNAYGYVCRSEAVDGDEVDVYLGDDMDAPTVYVVHQRKAGDWSKYDEDKVMIGFKSEVSARAAYLAHYDDERFLGPITAMPVDEFVQKVKATKDKPAMIKCVLFLRQAVSLS